MKIRTWILLGVSILCFSILLFPWFEILIVVLLSVLLGSYWHYWKPKGDYGPYLYYGTDPATNMWINLVLVAPSKIALKDTYYVELSPLNSFTTSNLLRYDKKEITNEAGRAYIHILCDRLTPHTQYFYRIGNSDTIIKSGRGYHFTTAPPSTPSNDEANHTSPSLSQYKARFIIYGDDQTADFFPILAQVTNHYQYAARPEFIVHLGDINQNIWHDEENNAFFQTKRKIFLQIPYLPVIGNHDAKPISRYNALYNVKHWYAFDYGLKLRILCLSGHDGFVPNTNGQFEFIEDQIQTGVRENRFIIVCVHETFYGIETNIPEEQPTLELRQYVLPLLQQYNRGIQRNILVFSGHIHEYCRIVRHDLTFFIEGACSNAKWYSPLQNDSHHTYDPSIAAKEYGRQSFALLSLYKDVLTVKICGWGKRVIESLEFNQ